MKVDKKPMLKYALLIMAMLMWTVVPTSLISCSDKDPVAEEKPEPKPDPDDPEEPDPDNNITGTVFAYGVGIPNVIVSDGYQVTTTDNDGKYKLNSLKEHGYIFISIPSGYMPLGRDGIVTPFFKHTQEEAFFSEVIDFELEAVSNADHSLFVMTDGHFINDGDKSGKDDISQIKKILIPELKSLAEEHKAAKKEFYVLALGDIVEDLYWDSFGYEDYLALMKEIDVPFFHTMGNHEYSVKYQGDWSTAKDYKKHLGPSYYSFNLGKVHYVVLDNMICTNPGDGKTRAVTHEMDKDQLAWLKEDLAFVDKNTPVVVALHIPAHVETIDNNGNVGFNLAGVNTQALNDLFAGFKEVYYLSGHTHINKSSQNGNILERNIAAISGSWWFTSRAGYPGQHICNDGSPGGYQLYSVSKDKISWQYKGLGENVDKQFRTYDRNQIHITADKYCPNASNTDKNTFNTKYTRGYNTVKSDNLVLINVWGWDPQWKIEVKENGTSLPVKRIKAYDPLKIISYEAVYFDRGQRVYDYASANQSTHFFQVQASSPTSTLEVKVTDRFGNVYEETMTRPKAFSIDTK